MELSRLLRSIASRRVAFATVLVVCVALLVISISYPVKQDAAWIDAVTGSMRHQMIWQCWPDSDPVITLSPLARWLNTQDIRFEYDWRKVQGNVKLFWGQTLTRTHGRAPPICGFRTEAMQMFVDHSSDDTIRQFVDIMKYGDDDAQHRAVVEAIERAFATN